MGGGGDIRGVGQTTRAFSCVVEIKGVGEGRESGRLVEGEPTWVGANGMSALSRLRAIRYPKRLKYYAG